VDGDIKYDTIMSSQRVVIDTNILYYLDALAAKGSTEVFDAVMVKVKNRPPLQGDEMYLETDEPKQHNFIIGATPPPLSETAKKQVSRRRPSKKAAKLAASAAKTQVVLK
jgi:hypothetical protein